MKILQICHKVPYPPRDGGSIAMYNLSKGLLELGNEVKVLAINTTKSAVGPPAYNSVRAGSQQIETVDIDTSLSVWDAFINLFSSESYNIKRFISKNFENKLIEILSNSNFDIIQLESLFVTPYINCIRKHSNAKVILRAHNIEFEIWERMAVVCKNPVTKAYLRHLSKRLRQYETNHLNAYDGIAAITHRDAGIFRKLGCRLPITDIPVGTEVPSSKPAMSAAEPSQVPSPKSPACAEATAGRQVPSLFHLGSMDWMPNREAMKWFLEKAWMKVHREHPGIKFYVAGRNMPGWLKKVKYKNVEIVEEAGDSKQFMNSKSIMLVPLLSGSGMRVKIIEGMALGKTIIATSVGAEGIKYEHLKNILIADTPDEFSEMIGKCVKDKSFCDNIGENARLLIKEHYNNTKIAEKLVGFYKTLQ